MQIEYGFEIQPGELLSHSEGSNFPPCFLSRLEYVAVVLPVLTLILGGFLAAIK